MQSVSALSPLSIASPLQKSYQLLPSSELCTGNLYSVSLRVYRCAFWCIGIGVQWATFFRFQPGGVLLCGAEVAKMSMCCSVELMCHSVL